MTSKAIKVTKSTRSEQDAKSVPIRVALAGLRGAGEAFLHAIQTDDAYRLVAVGDTDAEARRVIQSDDKPAMFEDIRSMIVESSGAGLDLVVAALEPFQSREVFEPCARGGVSVVHKSPFARSSAEACERLQFFPGDGPRVFVPRLWHYDSLLSDLHRIFELIGPVHALSASVASQLEGAGWRGDSVRAGGGVLLNGAYECIDLLVELLGMPERVLAEASQRASASGPRTYDTEDAISVSLRFPKECVASLTAVRGAAQQSWHIVFYGSEGTLIASNDGVQRITESGEIVKVAQPSPGEDQVACLLHSFAEAQRGAARLLPTMAAAHLPTLATIDAVYLSTQTGAPESPRQFLQ